MQEPHPSPEPPPETERSRGPLRWLLACAGLAFTLLGALGIFLPVLPTTPFLLLAATCFARSSETFHRRLLANRMFGPYITEWQNQRTIPLQAKRKAYGLIVLTFSISILMLERPLLQWGLGILAALLLTFLWWLPSSDSPSRPTPELPGNEPSDMH